MGRRHKQIEVRAEQKWDHINLGDFRPKGCGTYFAYGYLWFSLLLSIAFYAVDTFTAINLLAFDRWSSEIQPRIDKSISKWIFAICIIASFVNLVYEGCRATRILRRGNIAEAYLDNLAVRWQSIRPGHGQGWRRFLVFAELTRNKKGVEYLALFTHFSFQAWLRILVCSGPRQVVNADTLWGAYQANLVIPRTSAANSIVIFFQKLKLLAQKDFHQAVILSGMLFTLIVWAFSLLFLLAAILFYIFFFCHWIPKADGGLTGYCERKVNHAVMKIVGLTVSKALAKEDADRRRAEYKAAKKNGGVITPLERTATLPTLLTLPDLYPSDDKFIDMPTLNRADTMTTLPAYTSRPGTPTSFEYNPYYPMRPTPFGRTATMSSTASSKMSLVGGASEMGHSNHSLPASSVPSIDLNMCSPPRSNTPGSMRNYATHPGPNVGLSTNLLTAYFAPQFTDSPTTIDSGPQFPPPIRSATARTMDSYNELTAGNTANWQAGPAPRYDLACYTSHAENWSGSPGLTSNSDRSAARYGRGPQPTSPASPAPSRARDLSSPMVAAGGPVFAPARSLTGPTAVHGVMPAHSSFDTSLARSATTQNQLGSHNHGFYPQYEGRRDRHY